ncbi:MAG: GNAT family N-acetyltransferase [Cyanobacteria bacterium SIG29]|nr:GNAT family N-acetyltransferase [Cyanobacteria bacterium SIG29]
MQVANVNQIQTFKRNSYVSSVPVASNSISSQQKKSENKIPSSAYKANFLPSFGKYKRIANIPLLNKKTNNYVNASLLKEEVGDYSCFKIMVGSREAGYLNMNCDAIFPENGYLCPELDNNIPEIKQIRSLLGDEYYGIGTALINAAVDESEKKGKDGAVWCVASKGYARTFSPYRANENPIPFYYKLGFRSLDNDIDKLIKKSISSGNHYDLPDSTVLILSSQDTYDFKKYYSSQYTVEQKYA